MPANKHTPTVDVYLKAIKPNKVKSVLKSKSFLCAGCKKLSQSKRPKKETQGLWICLTCGFFGCEEHIDRHVSSFITRKPSASHPIACQVLADDQGKENSSSYSVSTIWCFNADVELKLDDKHEFETEDFNKLSKAIKTVEYYSKTISTFQQQQQQQNDDNDDENSLNSTTGQNTTDSSEPHHFHNDRSMSTTAPLSRKKQRQLRKAKKKAESNPSSPTVAPTAVPDTDDIVKREKHISSGVKGLRNLGNTCFFNSDDLPLSNNIPPVQHQYQYQYPVTQALLHTPPLVRYFIPELSIGDILVSPRTPPHAGPLSESFASLVHRMYAKTQDSNIQEAVAVSGRRRNRKKKRRSPLLEPSGAVLDPGDLFGQLCHRVPRFSTFHQQDAQELLRCLLDNTREEYLDGMDRKRFQGRHHNVIDRLFRGTLQSTVVCHHCGHMSPVSEGVFDVSVPIPSPEHRGRYNNAVDDDDARDGVTSKLADMSLEESDLDDTQRRRNLLNQNLIQKYIQRQIKHFGVGNKDNHRTSSRATLLIECMAAFVEQELLSGDDGYICDECSLISKAEKNKKDGISSDNPSYVDDDAIVSDSDCDSDSNNHKLYSSTNNDRISPSNDNREYSSSSENSGENDKDKNNEGDSSEHDQTSSTSPIRGSLGQDPFEISTEEETSDTENKIEKNKARAKTRTRTRLRTRTRTRTRLRTRTRTRTRLRTRTRTRTRTRFKPSESSIDPPKQEKKQQPREASKQLSISEPPEILTIHLKRFKHVVRRNRCTLKKDNSQVLYPKRLVLDPFITPSEITLKERPQYEYDLYAVVVHSGSLGFGHYVAYVKQEYDPSSFEEDEENRFHPEENKHNNIDAPQQNTTEQWFYFSDHFFKHVSQDEALSAEAYILFYRRIYK